MGVAEITTVSPCLRVMCLWVPFAILDNAASGSPWVPVHKIRTLFAGCVSTFSISIIISFGSFKYPKFEQISNILIILLPSIAIFLPWEWAIFTICCNLCTWDANAASIILPLAFENSSFKLSPTVLSDGVNPGICAFVLSDKSKSIPSSPSCASLPKSNPSPLTGVKSTLKSPECKIVAAGVFMQMA